MDLILSIYLIFISRAYHVRGYLTFWMEIKGLALASAMVYGKNRSSSFKTLRSSAYDHSTQSIVHTPPLE